MAPVCFVEDASALDAEVLRHGDLHALDVVAVPERLQERVGEAEEEQVLHRPLAQVMVDAEDRRLVEGCQQDAIELPRRGEVPAERLFDDDAGALGAARLAELLHDHPEQHGRDGEVVGRPLGGAEFLAQWPANVAGSL